MVSWGVGAQQEAEKKPLRLALTYHQQNDQLPIIKVSTKSKTGKKFEAKDSVLVNLFFGEETNEGFLGRVRTNMRGEASLQLSGKYKEGWSNASSLKFIATVTGSDQFDDASTEIEIAKAKIELTLEEKDSVKTISAKVLVYQDSGWVEAPDVEVKLVVKRLLKDLTAAEEDTYTTDETGHVSSEYAMIIPGDNDGNINIGVKIDDHELYGNIETYQTVPWGSRLAADNSFSKRTLWATRDKTPWWLLVFPNLIITTVWGVIFYLFYQIMQIRKLGKAKESV
jgi:hypothetical protein